MLVYNDTCPSNFKILIAPFSGFSMLISPVNDPDFFEIVTRVISDLPEGVWAHA